MKLALLGITRRLNPAHDSPAIPLADRYLSMERAESILRGAGAWQALAF